MLKRIKLTNLLSFGTVPVELDLGPLTVLIGPNGSGKSNLIEALSLLRSAPRELAVPVREGGGIRDWLWKGPWKGPGSQGTPSPLATVEVIVEKPLSKMPIRYKLVIGELGQRLQVVDERIENEHAEKKAAAKPYFYFGYEHGLPTFNVHGAGARTLKKEEIDIEQSVLSQRKDPDAYPEVTFIGEVFSNIRLYREWNLGRYTPPRLPQRPDLPNDALTEDGANLGLILNRLRKDVATKQSLLKYFKEFYPAADDVDVSLDGGTVQVFLQEHGWSVPATRFSDGMLRWLCLLAILLDRGAPKMGMPKLICIEEPEIGLHPDILPTVANLLREASTHAQVIVTTHSDVLVDALTDVPDAVVVCEKVSGATRLNRLNAGLLAEWLEKYSLGQLWKKGEIGGNLW